MDASLTGGLPMTVIGIGTVFTALLALIVTVSVTSRLLSPPAPRPTLPAPKPAQGAGAAGEGDDEPGDELIAVALAAYAYHLRRRRRAVPAAAPQTAAQWALAGRMRAMGRRGR